MKQVVDSIRRILTPREGRGVTQEAWKTFWCTKVYRVIFKKVLNSHVWKIRFLPVTILVDLERSNHFRRVRVGLALRDPPINLAARGLKSIIFQVGSIEANDSTLEKYLVLDQILPLEQVWKVNGLAARGRQCYNFQSGYYLTYIHRFLLNRLCWVRIWKNFCDTSSDKKVIWVILIFFLFFIYNFFIW